VQNKPDEHSILGEGPYKKAPKPPSKIYQRWRSFTDDINAAA